MTNEELEMFSVLSKKYNRIKILNEFTSHFEKYINGRIHELELLGFNDADIYYFLKNQCNFPEPEKHTNS